MKKWVILLMFISMIFLTGLNRIIGGNAYYYTTTVVFTLTALISYSIVTVLSYRAGVTMKNINYIYFFSMSALMSLAFFIVTVKNISYSSFDKLYFISKNFKITGGKIRNRGNETIPVLVRIVKRNQNIFRNIIRN